MQKSANFHCFLSGKDFSVLNSVSQYYTLLAQLYACNFCEFELNLYLLIENSDKFSKPLRNRSILLPTLYFFRFLPPVYLSENGGVFDRTTEKLKWNQYKQDSEQIVPVFLPLTFVI